MKKLGYIAFVWALTVGCEGWSQLSYMESELPKELVSSNVPLKNRLRRKALYNLDEVLHWSVRKNLRAFQLTQDPPLVYSNSVHGMRDFSHIHGYFSLFRPLVGKVSSQEEDVQAVQNVLLLIDAQVKEENFKELAFAEILSKALAYRDLKEGDLLFLRTGEEYEVGKVFHLWGQMPAFGLVPKKKGTPLLLFRGTDLSLDSQRGWASLMSDVDLAGPGFYAFKKAEKEIHEWLVLMEETHEKPQVMGFSLGGALASYTFIFENAHISSKPSYAFCPPGIPDKVFGKWQDLENQKTLHTYVTRGDVISKVGKLCGQVYELSTDRELKPVSAHTALMTTYHSLSLSVVDLSMENASR